MFKVTEAWKQPWPFRFPLLNASRLNMCPCLNLVWMRWYSMNVSLWHWLCSQYFWSSMKLSMCGQRGCNSINQLQWTLTFAQEKWSCSFPMFKNSPSWQIVDPKTSEIRLDTCSAICIYIDFFLKRFICKVILLIDVCMLFHFCL